MLRRPGGVPASSGGDYQSPYAKGSSGNVGVGGGGYGGGYASPAAPGSGGSYSGGYAGASPVPPPPFGGSSGAYGGSDSYNGAGSNGGYGGGGYGGSSSNGHSSSSSNNTQNPFGSSMYKDKRRNSGNTIVQKIINKLKDPTSWPILTTVLFVILTLYYRSKFNSVLKVMNLKSGGIQEIRNAWENIHGNHATKERVLTNVHEQHTTTTKRLQECERSKNSLIRERDEFRVKSERLQQQLSKLSSATSQGNKDSTTNTNATLSGHHHNLLAGHVQREKLYRDQLSLLQNATQTDSRRAVIEKFGTGPHYVELTVELPVVGQEDTWKRGTLTFEMAPLSMMPHSIHLFLQQVTHGLWNNGWFYINGPHVLQAGPQADDAALELAYELAHEKHGDNMDDLDERSIALEPFKEKGLAHLSFQEYSIQYPHIEWTVGFTGRPGGPDFYINKIDNSISHGPGGQKHHVDIPDTADACFARVYSGFKTIEELTRIPTVQDEPSYKNFYEEPIHIVSAKVLQYPPTQTLVDMQYLKYTPEQIKLKEALQLQQLQQQQLLSQQQQQQQQANVGMNTNNNNIQNQPLQQGVNVGTGAGGGVGVGVGMAAGGMNHQEVVGMGVGQQQQQQQPLYGSLNDGQHQQINNNNFVDPQRGQGQGQDQQYYHHNQQQQQQQQQHHQNDHHNRHKFKSHGNLADMVEA